MFIGAYTNGKKNGEGEFKWKDGSTYKGHFKDNVIEGEGLYKWSNGRMY